MRDKQFKATTIVSSDVSNMLVLEEAFNNWAEETKPASILHVQFYHDMETRVRGYQVVYEEEWAPGLAPAPPQEREPARMLV